MALTPNFSAEQSIGSPETITWEDTSTGSDGTITTRRIYLRLPNGNWLDEDGNESTTSTYTSWDYADTTLTMSPLSASTALTATVEWYAGATLTYTKTLSFCFNIYDYLFALELLQGQTSNPGIVQDTNYYNNFQQYIVNIFCEENAVTYGDDIYSSQGSMNRNLVMSQNESLYF